MKLVNLLYVLGVKHVLFFLKLNFIPQVKVIEEGKSITVYMYVVFYM